MTKAEFLNTLQEKLMGEVATPEIESTVRYYDEYISDASGQGQPEEDVIRKLGSPLLIARTIIDTAKQKKMGADTEYRSVSPESEKEQSKSAFRQFQMSSLAAKVIVAAVVVGILLIIFSIVRALIPFVLPVLFILFIVKMVSDRKK